VAVWEPAPETPGHVVARVGPEPRHSRLTRRSAVQEYEVQTFSGRGR
jgi:hypothetical protein